jgi:hypothetical protein
MFRLFAHSEPETHSEPENDVIDLTNEEGDVTEEEGLVIEEGLVTDLTGDLYFEKQIGLLCTVHSTNNAIGRQLIRKESIIENDRGIQDRNNSEGSCIMYNMEEMAKTVFALSDLQVTTLDTLSENPEQTLTFALLKTWGVANIIQNLIIMWTHPNFHRVALRYVDSKWLLLDSEENQPIVIDAGIFSSKMATRGAELSLRIINTIVPKSTILYFDLTTNRHAPIEVESL